jgi:hypothetical protein
MGLAASWVALKVQTPEDALEAFGLSPTGERWEFPEGPISGASLPDGWYLIWFADEFVSEGTLRKTSAGRDAIAGFLEEHVMYSATSGWHDGAKLWELQHDAQKGMYHLEANGELPAAYGAIREAAYAKQRAAGGASAEVDHIFDIPPEVGRSLTGFSFEGYPDETEFEILEK